VQRRQNKRLGQFFADAVHQPRPWIETDRHVGAGCARRFVKPRIIRREIVRSRDEPQRRCRIGRAAADSGRNRQILVEIERPENYA
jgi:hypothetical protein